MTPDKVKEMKTPEDCPRWENCIAQLCPLSSRPGSWYWNEDICKLKDFQNSILVRNQKKIARRKAEGVFTKAMLNRRIIIGKAIKGLATTDDRKAELRWLKKHKEYLRILTAEQKMELTSRVRSK